MKKKWPTAFPLALLAAISLTACGGSSGERHLRWESAQGGPLQVSVTDGAPPIHQTYVYIDNPGSTLRDARLRLRADFSTPVGFQLGGTVTRVPTVIDGHDEVWDLGDLQANARIKFPIGVWFDASPQLEKIDDVQLNLELSSPDLPSPISSSALVVSVSPQ